MCGAYFDLNNRLDFPSLPNQKHDTIPGRCYIDDLNDTLLELILLKLFSSKDLSISKCVSRRWNEVISNSDFVRQLTYQYFPLTLFLGERCVITEHPYFLKHNFCLDFVPSYNNSNIVAHHNDLFVTAANVYYAANQENVYYVANALTKQFVVVPLPLFEENYSTNWAFCMVGLAGVVDGVSSHGVTNSDHCNLGFRIVRALNAVNEFDRGFIVRIYSSQTAQWITQVFKNFCFYSNRHEGFTFKNKVYWLARSNILVIDPFSDDITMPRLINLPDGISPCSILGICRTRLRIADMETNYGSEDYPRIKVWEFDDCDDDYASLSSSNTIAKLRLVVNFSLEALEQYPIYSVLDHKASLFECNIMICCHPNDPDIVYFVWSEIVLLRYCQTENKS